MCAFLKLISFSSKSWIIFTRATRKADILVYVVLIAVCGSGLRARKKKKENSEIKSWSGKCNVQSAITLNGMGL